jgi:hypothetical protein
MTHKPPPFVLAVVASMACAIGCGNTFFKSYGVGTLLKKPSGKGLVIPTTIMDMDIADMVGRALPQGLPQFQWSTPEESMAKLRADPVSVGELSDIDLSTPHDNGLSKVEFQKLARAGYAVGADLIVVVSIEHFQAPSTGKIPITSQQRSVLAIEFLDTTTGMVSLVLSRRTRDEPNLKNERVERDLVLELSKHR